MSVNLLMVISLIYILFLGILLSLFDDIAIKNSLENKIIYRKLSFPKPKYRPNINKKIKI